MSCRTWQGTEILGVEKLPEVCVGVGVVIAVCTVYQRSAGGLGNLCRRILDIEVHILRLQVCQCGNGPNTELLFEEVIEQNLNDAITLLLGILGDDDGNLVTGRAVVFCSERQNIYTLYLNGSSCLGARLIRPVQKCSESTGQRNAIDKTLFRISCRATDFRNTATCEKFVTRDFNDRTSRSPSHRKTDCDRTALTESAYGLGHGTEVDIGAGPNFVLCNPGTTTGHSNHPFIL